MKGQTLTSIASHLDLSIEVDAPISGFAIDSRHVQIGELFFALKGEKVDGHEFLSDVARKGALAAVVSSGYRGEDFGLHLLRVENVRGALQNLAREAFRARSEEVVAITGSMGKTTTKEFLATLLSETFRVAKTPGNSNTQLSLPLFLLNLEGRCDLLVLEMGMSAKGEIAKLVEIAPPNWAMVTRIAHAGIPGGTLQEIAEAKGEIFSNRWTRFGLVSSQASPYFPGKMVYGDGGDFSLEKRGNRVRINDSPWMELDLDGDHLLENFLGAASMARMLGVSWHEIAKGAKKIEPFEKRFQKVQRNGVTFIQDSYNANPESVMAAMKALPKPNGKGRVIGALGSMVDLGDHSSFFHRQVGEFAAGLLDEVLFVGEEAKVFADAFSSSGKQVKVFSDVARLKSVLHEIVREGDVVLIKGANSHKLWEVLDV